MNQLTFEGFAENEKTAQNNPYSSYVPVLILKDFDVAWTDRNWFLREQDFVYLESRLAAMLVERGIARKTEI